MTEPTRLPASGPAFHRPNSIDEACTLLADEDAVALAGGQDLIGRLHAGTLRPRSIVSLAAIPELCAIELIEPGDQNDHAGRGKRETVLRIGAMATIGSISTDIRVRRHLSGPAQTLGSIANARVRAVATVGGNLARAHPWHHPPVILAAFGAAITVRGPQGARHIGVGELATDAGMTVLRPDELIISIDVPLPDGPAAFGFSSLPEGHRDNLPVAHAAVLVHPDGLRARVVVGAATPMIRVFDVDLTERQPESAARSDTAPGNGQLAEQVSDQLTFAGNALISADYRRHLATVTVARALASASGSRPGPARWSEPPDTPRAGKPTWIPGTRRRAGGGT